MKRESLISSGNMAPQNKIPADQAARAARMTAGAPNAYGARGTPNTGAGKQVAAGFGSFSAPK